MRNVISRAEMPFVPNSGLQDVSAGDLFRTSNSSDTTINTFDRGISGQQIEVYVADAHTAFGTSGNIQLPGAARFQAVAFATYQFLCRGENGPWTLVSSNAR